MHLLLACLALCPLHIYYRPQPALFVSMVQVVAAMTKARVPAGPILSTGDLMQEQQYKER
jgi:hypothetical protein